MFRFSLQKISSLVLELCKYCNYCDDAIDEKNSKSQHGLAPHHTRGGVAFSFKKSEGIAM